MVCCLGICHGLENAQSQTDGGEKTRDTNCHVELWFGLVKHSILLKKKYLRPAESIFKMFASMQGRYVEHIGQHNLPMQILDKNLTSSCRPDDDHEEQWNKSDSSTGQSKAKSKSKYFRPLEKLPNPQSLHAKTVKITKVSEEQKDTDAQVNMVS